MKILFWLYISRINKKGEAPIMLRITINKSRLNMSTGVFSKPQDWDQVKGKIKGNSPLVHELNRKLIALYTKAGKAYNDLLEKHQAVSIDMIRQKINEHITLKSLFTVFTIYREKMDKLVSVGKATTG